jgi:hypothetical protein
MEYNCTPCLYKTTNKKHYENHIHSKKHQKMCENNVKYFCSTCARRFATNSGLWRHKKQCETKTMAMRELQDSINDVKNMVIEMKAKMKTSIINTTNHIDINIFLNENFTRTPNLMDIIEEIPINGDYYKNMQEIGYVANITNMIVDKLKQLPIKERPIVCIKNEDQNQKVVHVRDKNSWKKETELGWVRQITESYMGDYDSDDPDDDHKPLIMYHALKKFQSLITQFIDEYYSKMRTYPQIRRENNYEMKDINNKIRIINEVIDEMKMDSL